MIRNQIAAGVSSKIATPDQAFMHRSLFYRWVQASAWMGEKIGAATPLEAEALERQALAITGRAEFSGSAFREPLEMLLHSLRSEARLNALGRYGASKYLIGYLATRLCMEEAWQGPSPRPSDLLNPARPPVFIVGLHRTGTTLLHKLLAADPAARPLRYWESAYPLVGPVKNPQNRSEAVRRRFALQSVAITEKLAPLISAIHRVDPAGPEECHWLTMATMVTHAFPMQWRVDSYREWLEQRTEADWDRSYAEYLSLLGMLDAGTKDRHWVLKCPLHAPRVDTLARLLPNAIFIQTYRDLRDVAGSLASLTMALRSMSSDSWNPAADGRDVANALARDTRAAVHAAALHPKRVFHVHYSALVKNPIPTIRGLYERAGLTWSPEGEKAMNHWLAANPQGRNGRHHYSLADFDMAETDLLKSCSDYVAIEKDLAEMKS